MDNGGEQFFICHNCQQRKARIEFVIVNGNDICESRLMLSAFKLKIVYADERSAARRDIEHIELRQICWQVFPRPGEEGTYRERLVSEARDVNASRSKTSKPAAPIQPTNQPTCCSSSFSRFRVPGWKKKDFRLFFPLWWNERTRNGTDERALLVLILVTRGFVNGLVLLVSCVHYARRF